MKKQHQLFLLFLIAFALQSCKKDLPISATVVKGNIVDEDNKPLYGIGFKVVGVYSETPLKQIITFEEQLMSDKEGNFRFEKVITSPTEYVQIIPYNSYLDKVLTYRTQNGTYDKAGISFVNIGIENEFNYKVIKR